MQWKQRQFSSIVVDPAGRKLLALLALAMIAVPCPGCSERNIESEPRNVLLLFIDTMRADRMSVYGYERTTTPHIEAFAATATTFERAYSPSSWTRASFASYFTGLYPSANGCQDREEYLDPALHTLAERFQERGFATAGIYANFNIAASLGFDQGFDLYEHPPPNVKGSDTAMFADAAAMNQRVLHWLRHERPRDPWFLFLLYIDPHSPYMSHPEHRFGQHTAPSSVGSWRYLKLLKHRTTSRHQDRIRTTIKNLYDGEIAYVDAHIGELLAALEAEGLADDTLVILSSDHGEGLWDHEEYRGHGQQVYEEQIHVPLIVRWPGRTQPGTRVESPVAAIDLFGALAEAYGLAKPREYQAGSFLQALAGHSSSSPIFVEEKLDKVAYRVLIDWPWKLIRDDAKNTYKLYDLRADPTERAPADQTQATRVADMSTSLDGRSSLNAQWLNSIEWLGSSDSLTEEEKRELRALGYVH